MYNRTIDSLFSLAEFADIGSLLVSPESSLVRNRREYLHFSFDLDGQPFHSIFKRVEFRAQLTLAAVLGHRPYSAEDLERRQQINQLLRLNRMDFKGRIEVDIRERLIFKANSEIHEILTPVVLISTITQTLLRNRPLIELGRELAVMSPSDLQELK
ncbi:MAG: hypothetical protein ORO03_09255 [Alphaproteobacteria bacterium]|nr:hypothetical protein [Alphaproteobacteria bacterium]